MADLCDKCRKRTTCMLDGEFDECYENDFINFKSADSPCEGCFYDVEPNKNKIRACVYCLRNPRDARTDNYISLNSEREAYNE